MLPLASSSSFAPLGQDAGLVEVLLKEYVTLVVARPNWKNTMLAVGMSFLIIFS